MPGHTGQPTRETTERERLRCDAGGTFLEASTRSSTVYQAQCDAPLQAGHRMPELPACQSAPARVARLAWARHSPRGLLERALARFLSRTTRQWRPARWPLQQPRENRRRCVRAINAIPCSRPCSLSERAPILPMTVAHMPCSWPSLRRCHRGRSGREWRSPAPGCSS